MCLQRLLSITFLVSFPLYSYSMGQSPNDRSSRGFWNIFSFFHRQSDEMIDGLIESVEDFVGVEVEDVNNFVAIEDEDVADPTSSDEESSKTSSVQDRIIMPSECAQTLDSHIENTPDQQSIVEHNQLIPHFTCALKYFSQVDAIERKVKKYNTIMIGSFYGGMGRYTLARAIAYKLGLQEVLVSSYSLVGKNPEETSKSISNVFEQHAQQENVALIIDHMHVLSSGSARYFNKKLNFEMIKQGVAILRAGCERNILIGISDHKSYLLPVKAWHIELEIPCAEQRVEIAQIMFADHNVTFADEHAVDVLRKIMHKSELTPKKIKEFVDKTIQMTNECGDSSRIQSVHARHNLVITEKSLWYAANNRKQMARCLLADLNARCENDKIFTKIVNRYCVGIKLADKELTQLVEHIRQQDYRGKSDTDKPIVITRDLCRRYSTIL